MGFLDDVFFISFHFISFSFHFILMDTITIKFITDDLAFFLAR